MKYLISDITNFHQELEGGHMKDQVGLVIQYYNIDFVFQKSLLVKEVLISHYLKKLRNPMKGLINTQSKNNKCFRWSLVRCLNPVNRNPAKSRNVDRKFVKQLNFEGVDFLVHKKVFAEIDKQNNIFISMFGYGNKTQCCIYTSKQNFEMHVDLLLLLILKIPIMF